MSDQTVDATTFAARRRADVVEILAGAVLQMLLRGKLARRDGAPAAPAAPPVESTQIVSVN